VNALFSHIRSICLYAALLLMLSARLCAQHFSLRYYNVNDGLPTVAATGVYQDKYGYLWVGNSGGISRFDGRQFANYGVADGLSMLGGTANLHDSRERLWITSAYGMAQFKNNKIITYPTSDYQNYLYVFHYLETKDGQIWAATSRGVYQFADTVWNKISLCPGFENNPCRNIVGITGELYVNYSNNIVCRDKTGHWRHIAARREYNSIFNSLSVQNNQVLVSTDKNIYLVRDHRLVPIYRKNISNGNYFSYFVDSKRRLWLAGEDLFKVSEPGDWQHLSDLPDQHGYHSFINGDSSHNIWSSTNEGLVRIRERDYTIINRNSRGPLYGIYNAIALADNRLLLSSGSKTGIQLFANNNFKQIMPPQGPGNQNYYWDPIDAYAFDDKNDLWMTTRFKKLLRFDGKKLQDFSGILHLKTDEFIYDFAYSKTRKKFFICADSTLFYGDATKLSTFIPRNTGRPIVKPTRLLELKNGAMLLYIARKGVFWIDKTDNLVSLIKETGADGGKNRVHLGVIFYAGAANSFWITVTGLGIYEYGFTGNGRPFLKNHLSTMDGLQNDNVLSLTHDRQNRLWVATVTGLDILQTNKGGYWEVFNYVKNQDLTISVTDYERLISDTAGNIWLSSPQKIIKFNTANIILRKEKPRIIIEKVALAFKETDWSKLADSLYSYYQLPYDPALNYNQNSLGIFFNAADLSASNSNPEYSYKLLPLETAWSIPSKAKSVSFAQLPAGTYQFMVRAKDNASGWSRPAVFRFTIKPPFWAQWWFRAAIIGIASFIVIIVFRTRITKIKRDAFIENQLKELEMKALKAQMNPHFIYNALNSIQALVANDKKTEGIHYIGSFSRLLRQVLDNSENNVISLDKELESIGLYIQLEALRLDMQLQYKKNVPENIVPEFEKIPPLILQPFVENALWHGLSRKEGEKEVIITVNANDDWLLCDIKDNGVGRAKAQEWKSHTEMLHQSKAIEITRKRLIDFNDDDSVSPIEFFDLYDNDNMPAGTHVTVRIKRKF